MHRTATNEGHNKRRWSAIGILTLIVICGCGRNDTRFQRSYVVAVFDDSAELTTAGQNVGRAMQPWYQGERADVEELEQAVTEMRSTVEAVRKKTDFRPRPDTPKVHEFVSTIQQFLDWQLEVSDIFSHWLEIVRIENPADIETRRAVIEELNALNEEELEWKRRINRLAEELGVKVQSSNVDE